MDEPVLLRHMTSLLELQRRTFHRQEEASRSQSSAGNALATTVTADGVTEKVFHRWPEDRVGERIAPKAIDCEMARRARSSRRGHRGAPARREPREARDVAQERAEGAP
jgi:hypothetical protein